MSIPKITDVRYVALAVKDFDAERNFLTHHWGLTEVESSDGLSYLAAQGSSEPFVMRLRRAEQSHLDLIGLALPTRADVDVMHRHLVDSSVKLIDAPHNLESPFAGYGFRFFDNDGRAIEVSADVKRGNARTLSRGESIPVRLSHVVLHAPDNKATVKFYEDVLGFKLSDWLGELMAFLRCGPAHHRLAILPGPPALNHVAFDMLSLDEMMRGIGRLASEGIRVHWGPGRHTAGNNTFSYYYTPNGHMVEYTAELEEVDDASWKPSEYPLSAEITDRWGTGRLITESSHIMPEADPALWKAPPV